MLVSVGRYCNFTKLLQSHPKKPKRLWAYKLVLQKRKAFKEARQKRKTVCRWPITMT